MRMRIGRTSDFSRSSIRDVIIDLRSFAYARGVGMRTIQKLMGHMDISTTSLYCDLSDEMLRNEVELQRLLSGLLSATDGQDPTETLMR
jgi:integrase